MSYLMGLPGDRWGPTGRSLAAATSSEDTVDMAGHVFNLCAARTRPLEVVGAGCSTSADSRRARSGWQLKHPWTRFGGEIFENLKNHGFSDLDKQTGQHLL